jgi:hypothetical protein
MDLQARAARARRQTEKLCCIHGTGNPRMHVGIRLDPGESGRRHSGACIGHVLARPGAVFFCFPSLNTYCLDVVRSKGRWAEVVAGNHMVRDLFEAAGSAAVLPAVEKIGVLWFSTMSCDLLMFSAELVLMTTIFGE